MEGPEVAAQAVAARLSEQMPLTLAAFAVRYGVAASSLPHPMLLTAHEYGPLALEQWPALHVLGKDLLSMKLIDRLDDGDELYRCVYQLRVLCWVRADQATHVDVLRKRYVLAVRETLLRKRSLAGPADNEATVIPESIRENYSDLFTDPGAGDMLAGGWLDVQVAVAEVLHLSDPIGVVATIEVAVGVLGDTGPVPPPAGP